MSGADRLEALNREALAIIGSCEERIGELQHELETYRARLDTERRRLGAAIDELSARYYDQLTADAPAEGRARRGPLDLEAFRATEREMTDALIGSEVLASKLNNLTNLLNVSRGQFAPQGEAATEFDPLRVVERIAMIKAQEEERARLAREVHDGPAQVLANAILGLELCEQIARRSPAQLIDEIARLKLTVREGLLEVRRFQFDLRPSSLAERGLLVTLQRYITDYRAFFHLDVELQVPESLPPLSKDEELQTFRIIQEALQNIQKHARASRVGVQIAASDEAIVATIEDNGRGFVPQQTETTVLSGAGLHGMQERATAVGGLLEVESQPGVGTTIRFSLPRGAGA